MSKEYVGPEDLAKAGFINKPKTAFQESEDPEKKELKRLFKIEAQSRIKEISQAIIILKTKPKDKASKETIQRAAHALEGNSMVLANYEAGYYANKLDQISKTANSNLIEQLFTSLKHAIELGPEKLSPEKKAEQIQTSTEMLKKLDKVEQEKEEADKKYKLQAEIMKNVAEGIYLIGLKDFKIKYTSPRFEKMFGYNPKEMIDKPVEVVNAPVPGQTPKQIRDGIVALLRKEKEWHGEVENIKKDGTHFWCHANVSIFDHPEFGEVIVSVHSDITKQKKSEDQFKNIIKNLPLGIHIFELDSKGKLNLTGANLTADKLLKIDNSKLIGKEITKAFPKITNTEIPKKFYELAKKGGSWNKEAIPYENSIYNNYNFQISPGKMASLFLDVTEQKKSQKQIENLSKFPSENPNPVFRISKEGILLYSNQAGIQLLDQEKIKVGEKIPVKWNQLVKDIFLSKKPLDIKYPLANSQLFSISIYPILDKDYLNAYGKEITSEEKAKKEKDSLIKNIPGMVYKASSDWKTNIVTGSEKLCGYTSKELNSGKINWLNIIHPDDKDRIFKEGSVIAKKPMTLIQEYKIIDKNKNIRTIKDHKASTFEAGKFAGVIGIIYDVTEKKKQEEFSQTILNSVPYGMDIVDENLNIVYMNKAFLDIFGEKSIGKKCYQIYKDNKTQCEKCPLKKPIKIGETKTLKTTGVAGGKTFNITHTGVKLPDGKKAVLETFTDLSEKLEKEEKIKKLTKVKDEMAEIYKIEADKALLAIKTSFEDLKTDPNNQKKIYNLFRGAHTLKSSSLQMGFYPVGYVASLMTDMLREVKIKKIIITPEKLAFLQDFIGSLEKSINYALKGKEFEVDKRFFDKINKIMESSVKIKLKKDEAEIKRRMNKINK